MSKETTIIAVKKDAKGDKVLSATKPEPQAAPLAVSSDQAAALLAAALPAMHRAVRVSQDATNKAFETELVRYNALKGKYDVNGQEIGKADKQTRNFIRALQQMEKAAALTKEHSAVEAKEAAIPAEVEKTPEPAKA